MSMKSVLITGANRGIGLGLVKQFLQDGFQVYACCRSPEKADALNEYANDFDHLTIIQCDVYYKEQITTLANNLDASVDILINNAGVFTVDPIARTDFSSI
jgi:NAD(P)-dependent dehydrogenase (short-subunit alcohol dehydrogenase family)